MQHIVRLKYDGEEISDGLEPSAFLDALRGFAEFVVSATEEMYGSDAEASLKVHRLSTGSLILELLQTIGDLTVNDIVALSTTLSTQMEQALDLLKHLKGSPAHHVERTENNRVAVENNHGQVAVFQHSTVNLVINADVGSSLERIARPLASGRATAVRFSVDDTPAGTVSLPEVSSMKSVAREENLLANEAQVWLTATKVVLEGEANWTFTDGRRPFSAPITDRAFLDEVRAGNAKFGNGDKLLVMLRSQQSKRGAKLRTSYEVVRVLRHLQREVWAQAELI